MAQPMDSSVLQTHNGSIVYDERVVGAPGNFSTIYQAPASSSGVIQSADGGALVTTTTGDNAGAIYTQVQQSGATYSSSKETSYKATSVSQGGSGSMVVMPSSGNFAYSAQSASLASAGQMQQQTQNAGGMITSGGFVASPGGTTVQTTEQSSQMIKGTESTGISTYEQASYGVSGGAHSSSYVNYGNQTTTVGGDSPVYPSLEYQSTNFGQTIMQDGYITTQMSEVTTEPIPGAEYRVIGHEYGQERVISTHQYVDESRATVISERYVEHEVRVPKRILREDVVERVIVRPETQLIEEKIEEVQKVRQKIVEVAKPTIVEKVVEVPEIEWVVQTKTIEGDKIVQEKLEYVDKIVEEREDVYQEQRYKVEQIREVPDVKYRDVPVEKIVEVPEYKEEVVWRDVPTPYPVEKRVSVPVEVEKFIDFDRKIPIPVEAVIAYEYRMPRIKPRYSKVTYPVWLPRFIEIPVPVDLLNANLLQQAEQHLSAVQSLRATASMCEIEGLAMQIIKADLPQQVQSVDLQAAVLKAWQSNTFKATTTTTSTSGSYRPVNLIGGVGATSAQYGATTTTTQQQYASGQYASGQYTSSYPTQYISGGGASAGGITYSGTAATYSTRPAAAASTTYTSAAYTGPSTAVYSGSAAYLSSSGGAQTTSLAYQTAPSATSTAATTAVPVGNIVPVTREHTKKHKKSSKNRA